MLPHAIWRVEQRAIYSSEFFGPTRPTDAERATFRPRSGVPSNPPAIPLSRIHLTWASYLSARDWDSSAGLARVGADASTKLPLVFFSRQKCIGLLFLRATGRGDNCRTCIA